MDQTFQINCSISRIRSSNCFQNLQLGWFVDVALGVTLLEGLGWSYVIIHEQANYPPLVAMEMGRYSPVLYLCGQESLFRQLHVAQRQQGFLCNH